MTPSSIRVNGRPIESAPAPFQLIRTRLAANGDELLGVFVAADGSVEMQIKLSKENYQKLVLDANRNPPTPTAEGNASTDESFLAFLERARAEII